MKHDFQLRLERILRGREAQARYVSLTASRGRDGLTRLFWRDEFTEEQGYLGSLAEAEVPRVVPALFAQLRAWRELAQVTNAMARGKVRAARAGGLP